jgi:hypothetical protein
MSKSYQNRLYQLTTKEREAQTNYLTGLYTHRYKDLFYLQYNCPLCGDEIHVTRQLENNMPVDYEKHVAGEMMNHLRADLAAHYKRECGSDRARRHNTGEILFDKFMDGVYE